MRTCVWKIRPAPRRPGNICTCSVILAPALSTSLTGQNLPVPIHRASHERMRAEGAPEDALRLARGREQRVQVDAGLDPHLVQHRDEVLAGDVAGRALGHRAAAELAEAQLE